MLKLLNIVFHSLHVGLILFILTGWIWSPFRLTHLAFCGLILVSWFGIGIAVGRPGFCLITEIQYRIRKRMGLQDSRQSYMVYLSDVLTGHSLSEGRMEVVTQVVFYTVSLLSLGLVVWG